MKEFIAALLGVLFGGGLILSGMTDPEKVRGFLDVAGQWDPSLALVMVGAITIAAIGYVIARRRPRSWLGDPVDIPTTNTIDARLILGGVLFGIGWGLAGMCPGPALVNAGAGHRGAVIFVLAMLAGMLLHDHVSKWLSSRRP
jgi:hypothetical protein